MSQRKRGLWGTRFGFYLAAVGSAFGLGNLWRFPYVTVENGGGAFVLLYVIFALGIGLSLLIGELMLGKLSRRSLIAACHKLTNDPALSAKLEPDDNTWVWVGRISVFSCLLILSYYAVISGWVLHFLMQFAVGHWQYGSFDVEASLKVLRDNGGLQIALTSVHLLFTLIIVAKGVQEGMEKWVSFIMPAFVALLVVLVTKALSLPSAPDALRFLFYPDFSKLTAYSPLHALGHVLFTLSIGFGTMVTFGSYLNDQTKIPAAGFRVTTMDTLISLFAGLLIFPLLIGGNFTTTGPELLFQTLPRLLLDLDRGFFFGMAFFLCLYLAALGASIGLLESLVANLMDLTRWSRTKATWVTGLLALVFAMPAALSTSVLRELNFRGRPMLEIFDRVLVNGFLPMAALGVAVALVRHIRKDLAKEEFVNDDSMTTLKLYSHWHLVMAWVAPVVIVGSMLLAVWGFLQSL